MGTGRKTEGLWLLSVAGGASKASPEFHPLADEWRDIDARERRAGIPPGQPALVSTARVDYRLGDYFRSAFRADQASTAQTYAAELRTWLNFLSSRDTYWDEADHRDVRAFQIWRVYDQDNPSPIQAATWNKGWGALKHFYAWALRERWVEGNPVQPEARLKEPGHLGSHREKHARASRDRWLTPSEYRLWRDVGYRGYEGTRDATGRIVPGLPNPAARSRNTSRNVAFADYMLTTGLRLTEAGGLLSFEVPEAVNVETPLVGKGGVFRHYRVLHRLGLESLRDYAMGERRDAVRRGRRTGHYKHPDALRIVEIIHGRRGQRVRLVDGRVLDVPTMPIVDRSRLLIEGPSGPEPCLALAERHHGRCCGHGRGLTSSTPAICASPKRAATWGSSRRGSRSRHTPCVSPSRCLFCSQESERSTQSSGSDQQIRFSSATTAKRLTKSATCWVMRRPEQPATTTSNR